MATPAAATAPSQARHAAHMAQGRTPFVHFLALMLLGALGYTLKLLEAQLPELVDTAPGVLNPQGAAVYATWPGARDNLQRAWFLVRHAPTLFWHLYVVHWCAGAG
jgi:hypothetical protein